MATQQLTVPDIGGAENVEVIEISVKPGDKVNKDDTLIVLESDKASMEIPAPAAGTVKAVLLKVGDKVSQGSAMIELDAEGGAAPAPAPQAAAPAPAPKAAPAPAPQAPATPPAGSSAVEAIAVPDIGTGDEVEVIEVSVAVGAQLAEGDTMVVLESDKASMEVPAPKAGTVRALKVSVGDKIRTGSVILDLETVGAAPASSTASPPAAVAPAPQSANAAPTPAVSGAPAVETIAVPDIGTSDTVDVIEVSVAVGAKIAEGDAIVVLESDKASMEIPAPKAGIVRALKVSVGDKVSTGTALIELETTAGAAVPSPAPTAARSAVTSNAAAPGVVTPNEIPQPSFPVAPASPSLARPETRQDGDIYAGPAVRRLAREMGIDLARVPGSGPKGRIQKDDVKKFVKELMENRGAAYGTGRAASGAGIPPIPEVDFAQFGPVDVQPLTNLHKAVATNMHRAWLNVPHVTQWDDADITELENFRESLKGDMDKRGVKLSPLPFLFKAIVATLKAHPKFNASLHADGEHIVYKQYFHIGMAVDTPAGLVVPVLRDVDKKSVWELAAEAAELAQKAKDRKLKLAEMQGGCFSISSLGNIGGLGFTPIVNAPEVAILGVSKLTVKPAWNGSEFVPRKMLPLSLSYDHRAINGGDAGRFFATLNQLLGDIRRLVL